MVTRRQVLKAGGAAAALGAVGGCTPDGGAGGGDASGSDAAPAGDATGGTTTGVPASVAELPRLSFPEAGSGTGLNVIVIVVDTLRRDHVGVYGGDTQTPAIDALAADGLRFTRFLPETMPSVPVRRTVHSGRRAFPGADWAPVKGDFPLLAGWQPIPNTQPTMAETFAFAGYTTAIVADTPHLFKSNMNYGRGFQTYRWVRGHMGDHYRPAALADRERMGRYMVEEIGGRGPLLQAYVANTDGRTREQDYQAPKVFGEAMSWLREARSLSPFLLVVDSFDPHEPWDPPVSYIERYDDPTFDGREPVAPGYGGADWMTDGVRARMDVLYKASITMVDAWIGRFLDEADGLGLLDDTIVVFMSDHGILLGEHDLTGKPPSDSMWPEMTDVPLIIRHPDGPRGTTADLFASTHDVAPTILGAAGLTPAARLDGIDLSPLVVSRDAGDVERRDHISQMYDTKFTVRTDRYMFVASDDGGTRRLFDLEEDPGATTDVADRQAAEADRLWALLLEDAGGELPQWDREAIAAHLATPPTSPPAG